MSTRAYVDLMFAWAHARLGDPVAARPLAEDATLRLSTGDGAHQWLASAFGHRIRQAENGESPTGEWPVALLDALAAIDSNRLLASLRYIVDQVRYRSRVLEPDLRTDPYTAWKRYATSNAVAVAELESTTDPDRFASHFQSLLAATAGTRDVGDRLRVIESAANHGRRASTDVVEVIYREGLRLLDQFFRVPPDLKDADDRFRSLVTALCELAVGRVDHSLLGRALLRLADWVRYGDHTAGRPAGLILFDVLLPRLYRADMASDAALLLDLGGEAGELLHPIGAGPDDDLPRQLQLAGCERWLGLRDRSEPVFERARTVLFGEGARRAKPGALIRVAAGYALALGRGPVVDCGTDLMDLFVRLPGVPNGFTTATHFSRLHLELAEAAILAVTTDDFRPARELGTRFGADELSARRAVLPPLRERIQTWVEANW